MKYSYTNPAGGTSAGTYGYYDFSLNENDNNYIKDVFGVDPTVGNPNKQIAGQKVEAAYNYVLFEDSIKKFVAEKTSAYGWRLQVGTSNLSGSSIVGEPLKFVDQYSTDLNNGDSQFSITNASTPWIYSQKIAPFKGSADVAASPTKFQLFKVHTLSDGTVVAAHRNEGKGMGLKNSDALTCSLCYHCHYELDAGNKLTKDQKRDMWNRAYVNTMQYLWEHDMIGIK